jgi:hypothetical protein
VQVGDIRGVPKTLVNRAIELQNYYKRLRRRGAPLDFDQIWCVFDGGGEHPGTSEVCAIAKATGIFTVISVPCFDVWQLLHWEELSTRPLTAEQAKRRIRTKYCAGYGRGVKIVPYSMLAGRYEVAIRRAKTLRGFHKEYGGEANPSTEVFYLVEEILKVGSAERFVPEC